MASHCSAMGKVPLSRHNSIQTTLNPACFYAFRALDYGISIDHYGSVSITFDDPITVIRELMKNVIQTMGTS